MLRNISFSRFIRDDLVLSIQEKVRKGYTNDILVKRLHHFATEMMNTIAVVAAGEIYVLFQPHTRTMVSVNTNRTKHFIQSAEVAGGAGGCWGGQNQPFYG